MAGAARTLALALGLTVSGCDDAGQLGNGFAAFADLPGLAVEDLPDHYHRALHELFTQQIIPPARNATGMHSEQAA